MQGNPKLLEILNSLLADELTAINQYMVHAELCESWGYEKLAKVIEQRAIQEMRHAEKLIRRILFLEGRPIVSQLRQISIGDEVPKMFAHDHKAEFDAIKAYNEAIKLAGEVSDFATRELLESILQDEDKHIDEIEEALDQIKQMGLPIFLATKA